ncbi:hypothetical protein HCH_00557 [Hahella chejuensis KCTC 2396]|uniref:Uncharacterized protein n=1 Tax=Hahella chejuensis (strain KCTC 2396) TaxID=349521 RepID=Q2SPG3_HAHCH|nr:hypothetical protein HCH_00557 [Hahella chejuensis KCTC 2396]
MKDASVTVFIVFCLFVPNLLRFVPFISQKTFQFVHNLALPKHKPLCSPGCGDIEE